MSRRLLRLRHVLVLSSVLFLTILVTAGAATPVPTCFGRAPTIVGTAGPDTLNGTPQSDVIAGLDGNDTINGGGGSDYVCGGDGNDTIYGAAGNDRISGDSGADLLVGGKGNDRILGAGGNDTLKGQAGGDTLHGGPGADNAAGGPGTDTCTKAESRSSCEVIPPTGCSNPPLVPATPHTTNVTVTGSNAFATRSSWLIDGEARRLTFVAEVRNDGSTTVRLADATITIRNAAGAQIGKRYASPRARVLASGQRTVLAESMPSLFYFSGETNSFPEGWASWELTLGPTTGSPGSYDYVIIGSRLSLLTADADGNLTARGAAVNSLGRAIDDVYWWVVLHDARGALINVLWAADNFYPEGLAPGGRATFEVTIRSDQPPTCFAGARWGAAGS